MAPANAKQIEGLYRACEETTSALEEKLKLKGDL